MFKNNIKKQELINREVNLYRKEKFLEVDKSIEDYRFKKQNEIQDLAKRCHEDSAKYEHTYHSAMELKKVELAKLESKNEALAGVIKAREEVVKADQNLLNSKDAEIKRLNDIVNLLINKPSQPLFNS